MKKIEINPDDYFTEDEMIEMILMDCEPHEITEERVSQILHKACVSKILSQNVDANIMQSHISEDGEILFSLTEKGQEIYKELLEPEKK